jgi:hypothetical protein
MNKIKTVLPYGLKDINRYYPTRDDKVSLIESYLKTNNEYFLKDARISFNGINASKDSITQFKFSLLNDEINNIKKDEAHNTILSSILNYLENEIIPKLIEQDKEKKLISDEELKKTSLVSRVSLISAIEYGKNNNFVIKILL